MSVVIFARVEVKVSMTPVVNRPSTAKKFVEVAFVIVALVARIFVKRLFVATKFVVKKFVVVALVPVLFAKVKFWRVEEPVARIFDVVSVPERV